MNRQGAQDVPREAAAAVPAAVMEEHSPRRDPTAGPPATTHGEPAGRLGAPCPYRGLVPSTPRFSTSVTPRGSDTVVVKAGSGDAAVVALRREAALLEAIDHPGFVEFLAIEFPHRPNAAARLITRFAGTHTIHTAPPASIPVTIRRAGQLLASLASLHNRGLLHGAVDPSHLVVAPLGSIRWCGVGSAAPGTPEARIGEAHRAAGLALADLDSARLPRRRRRHALRLRHLSSAILTDERLDAASMALALTHLLWASAGEGPPNPAPASAQAQRHFVGQKSTGDTEHEPVTVELDEAVEHSGAFRWWDG